MNRLKDINKNHVLTLLLTILIVLSTAFCTITPKKDDNKLSDEIIDESKIYTYEIYDYTVFQPYYPSEYSSYTEQPNPSKEIMDGLLKDCELTMYDSLYHYSVVRCDTCGKYYYSTKDGNEGIEEAVNNYKLHDKCYVFSYKGSLLAGNFDDGTNAKEYYTRTPSIIYKCRQYQHSGAPDDKYYDTCQEMKKHWKGGWSTATRAISDPEKDQYDEELVYPILVAITDDPDYKPDTSSQTTTDTSTQTSTTTKHNTTQTTTKTTTEKSTSVSSNHKVAVGDVIKSSKSVFVVKSTVKKEVAYKKTRTNSTSVVIPETLSINGKLYKVTSVSASAFKGNKKIKKITIGSNITSVGGNAFNGCTNLQTVNILSTKVKGIGNGAFANCKNLNKIALNSKNLTTIGSSAFKNCNKLKKITIKSSKVKFSSGCFSGINKKAIFTVPKSKVDSYKKSIINTGKAPKTITVKNK